MKFKCIKPTTYKGRQVFQGTVIDINNKVAKSFKGNPCFEEIKQPSMRETLFAKAKSIGVRPPKNISTDALTKLIIDAED